MRRAFTLIELLVVISIIALLIAILLPVLSSTRYEAANFLCVNRQRQWVIAATAYTVENKDYYPDRGIDTNSGQSENMWARWAARMWIDQNVDENLDEILGQYLAETTSVWVCPQYAGAHNTGAYAGCLEHGKGHFNGTANQYRWTTYGFHGGLAEGTNDAGSPYGNAGTNIYNPGGRKRLGDKYVIEDAAGNTIYESGLLMSDVASDDNAWVPTYYPGDTGLGTSGIIGGVTTNHQPKPGTPSTLVNDPRYRIQAVGGRTHTNWAYDDGSAETRMLDPGSALTSDEWVAVRDGNGNRYFMYPD